MPGELPVLEKRTYSPKEAAVVIGVSVKTVFRIIRRRSIAVRRPTSRRTIIDAPELMRFLKRTQREAKL